MARSSWSLVSSTERLVGADDRRLFFLGSTRTSHFLRRVTLQSGGRVMEHGNTDHKPRRSRSFVRASSLGSSFGARFLSLPQFSPFQLHDDAESENVSEAGDIGDRALSIDKRSDGGNIRVSFGNAFNNSGRVPILVDDSLQSYGFRTTESNAPSPSSVSPLPEEIVSPLTTDAIIHPKGKGEEQEEGLAMPPFSDYLSCLIYLAVFGIFGVMTRYLLQKLFGPGIIGLTSDYSPLYFNLPSNMVGSFLMGWLGVVFKGDISRLSSHLAIGLTTGYLGSLTTFSGWNQKMLDLLVDGHWVLSLSGFFIGLFLAAYSIIFGVRTAKHFKLLVERLNRSRTDSSWRVDNCKRHLAVVVLTLILGILWGGCGILLKKDLRSGASGAKLWLACIVAAPGVWIRWFLARLNGRGLGKVGHLKWFPFGTFIANVSAACIMAALARLKKDVNTETCTIISTGLQFGFSGCLSTVSTFIAEYHAMEDSSKSWRAYVYALTSITVSFALGILIYRMPAWTGR